MNDILLRSNTNASLSFASKCHIFFFHHTFFGFRFGTIGAFVSYIPTIEFRILLCVPSILLVHQQFFDISKMPIIYSSSFYVVHSFILFFFSSHFRSFLWEQRCFVSTLVELQVLRWYIDKWWWLVWLLMAKVSYNFYWI